MGLRTECIGSFCENNFQKFWDAEPNQIGDTLAGLFSALAFIWIIVTVFLQSQELREQRKEFREQRLATQDLAKSSAAQAKIFELEQKEREQKAADAELMALVEEAVLFNERILRFKAVWYVKKVDNPWDSEQGDARSISASFAADLGQEHSFYQTIRQTYQATEKMLEDRYFEKATIKPDKGVFLTFVTILRRISALEPQTSPAMQSFLRRTDFNHGLVPIKALLAEDDAWSTGE